MDITSWQAQLRKGTAELVVLSLLADRARYGLEILELAGGSGGVVSEGSIYPLLTRLEKEGKLKAQWVLAPDAKIPRKYYSLSREGAELVAEMRRIWAEFSAFVSSAIEEAGDGKGSARPGRALPLRAG
jgi:PadR family transcriptional regulator PadR